MLAQVVLFDGFDPLDAIAPYEVLVTGADVTAGDRRLEVELVTAEGPREVPGGVGGLSLRATARLDPDRADLVVVPGAGGSMPDGGEPAEGSVLAHLRRAVESDLTGLLARAVRRPDVTVATVCGGSLLLAMAGLIRGRPATTHRMGLDALAAAGVRALDVRVVDDGDLVTSSSVTSGLDLGLHLLERLIGPRVAIAVEGLVAHERRGTVWRAGGPDPVVPGVRA
ncbi:DJ-1/PfpI family protein [Saccharothrix xinjiangensis]|uniref:DJ-1/PfpI family protein n=1 Tax=Saccharothrix xinjiangensis TaxID=204798 RepID=A0ABV9YF86_9PSEU